MSRPIGQHKWIDNPYMDRTRVRSNQEWIGEFVLRHLASHSHALWPDEDSPERDSMEEEYSYCFELNAITALEAYEASKMLKGQMTEKGVAPYPNDHLRMLIQNVKSIRERKERMSKQTKVDPNRIADALSAGCHDCGGNGIALRFRTGVPKKDRTYLLNFLCVCPSGRRKKEGYKPDDCPFLDLAEPRFTFLLASRVRWTVKDKAYFRGLMANAAESQSAWRNLCPDFLRLSQQVPDIFQEICNPYIFEPLLFDRVFGPSVRTEFVRATEPDFSRESF